MKLRTLALSAVLFALFAGPAYADHDRPNAKSLSWQMEELLKLAGDEVRGIDNLVESADRAAVRRELHHKTEELSRLFARIQELSRDLATLAAEPVVIERVIEVAPAPQSPQVCDAGDFGRVLQSVKAESFSDARLGVLRDAVGGRWFDVAQVKTMMSVFSFGDEKIDAAVLMHPRVVDPQNWYQVYGTLTFDSEKDTLRKRLGQ